MKIKNVAKAVCFMLIGVLMVVYLTKVMSISNEYSEHAEMMINGFYELDEDSADVVFIGNSHVYRYWQPAFAWKESGLASASISTSDLPFSVVKNVAEEALKTQSPKVLVFDASSFSNAEAEQNNKIYLLLDNMKYSLNYFDMIGEYCDYTGIKGLDRLQYYFPLVQFHDRWKDLSSLDFIQTQSSYLNSCYQENFLTSVLDDGSHTDSTGETEPVYSECEKALRSLLDWAKEQDCKVVFYGVPTLKNSHYQARLQYVLDIVEEYGFDTINFNDAEQFEKTGLDTTKDYQDKGHTNINGSFKFTTALSEWLMDRYGLESHTGDESYASWDEQADEYYEIVTPHMYEGLLNES